MHLPPMRIHWLKKFQRFEIGSMLAFVSLFPPLIGQVVLDDNDRLSASDLRVFGFLLAARRVPLNAVL